MDLPPSTSFSVAPMLTTADELFTAILSRIVLHQDVFVGDFKKKIIKIIDACLKKSNKSLETIIQDFSNTINECLLQFEQQSDSNQEPNDRETKPFEDCIKTVLDSIEQIDSCPELLSNTPSVGSETCMSKDGTSAISCGTSHNKICNNKRKIVELSRVSKRVYKGRTSEVNKNKSELPKGNNTKTPQTPEQKAIDQRKENMKLPLILKRILLRLILYNSLSHTEIPN